MVVVKQGHTGAEVVFNGWNMFTLCVERSIVQGIYLRGKYRPALTHQSTRLAYEGMSLIVSPR